MAESRHYQECGAEKSPTEWEAYLGGIQSCLMHHGTRVLYGSLTPGSSLSNLVSETFYGRTLNFIPKDIRILGRSR